MNVWNFTGNLGGDCEVRYTPDSLAVANFSVAVKAGYGQKQSTAWVRCSLFGKRAESVAPFLLKGTLVGVSGECSVREWTDKEGGKRSSLELRVNDVTLLGGKRAEGEQPAQEPKQERTPEPAKAGGKGFDDLDNDIPW